MVYAATQKEQKMTKFVLSLDANYVKSWTIADAIRELFQKNALDQQLPAP